MPLHQTKGAPVGNDNRPSIRAYIGATGSGKGVSVRQLLKLERPRRLLVWDPLSEYGEFCKHVTGDLAQVAKLCKGDAFTVAYWPGPDASKFAERFDLFCRIAFAAGNLCMLVEELSDVTTPSFAPPSWRRCSVQGRHRGLRIVAASQRPAQVDKQFLGGCTFLRVFALRYPADRKAVADVLDVPVTDVAGLVTTEEGAQVVIRYIERDFNQGAKATPGVIKLRKK